VAATACRPAYMIRYWAEILDAGMPMPAASAWVPMPSYAITVRDGALTLKGSHRMGDGRIFQKIYAPLSLMKAFRMNLISAGSISLTAQCTVPLMESLSITCVRVHSLETQY
jgi:hypothetical protein